MDTVIPRRSTVADVMTRVVATAGPLTPQPDLATLLSRLGIGAVPVVDEAGRPLGTVSEEATGSGRSSPTKQEVWLEWMPPARQHAAAVPVAAQLMTAPADAVEIHTPVEEAARLLATPNRRRLLVVDASGRLVGILTRRDLLRALVPGGPLPAGEGHGDAATARAGAGLRELETSRS